MSGCVSASVLFYLYFEIRFFYPWVCMYVGRYMRAYMCLYPFLLHFSHIQVLEQRSISSTYPKVSLCNAFTLTSPGLVNTMITVMLMSWGLLHCQTIAALPTEHSAQISQRTNR